MYKERNTNEMYLNKKNESLKFNHIEMRMDYLKEIKLILTPLLYLDCQLVNIFFAID